MRATRTLIYSFISSFGMVPTSSRTRKELLRHFILDGAYHFREIIPGLEKYLKILKLFSCGFSRELERARHREKAAQVKPSSIAAIGHGRIRTMFQDRLVVGINLLPSSIEMRYSYTRQRVAKLHVCVIPPHHPNVGIDLAFSGTPKRSAATATNSIAMMQRAT